MYDREMLLTPETMGLGANFMRSVYARETKEGWWFRIESFAEPVSPDQRPRHTGPVPPNAAPPPSRLLLRKTVPGQPRYLWKIPPGFRKPAGYKLYDAREKVRPKSERGVGGREYPADPIHSSRLDGLWIVTEEVDVWAMKYSELTAVCPFDNTGYVELAHALSAFEGIRNNPVHILLAHSVSGRKNSIALARVFYENKVESCIYALPGKEGRGISHEFRDCKKDTQAFRARLKALDPVEKSALRIWMDDPDAGLSPDDFKTRRRRSPSN